MTGLQEIQNLVEAPVAYAGEPRVVPPAIGAGAYRVVRDALASCGSGASVAIEFMPGAVAVQVEHDCGCPRDLGELEALAAALGGGVSGRRCSGRFRVRAWLPTEGLPQSL